MHPFPGNLVAIGRVVVYYACASHTRNLVQELNVGTVGFPLNVNIINGDFRLLFQRK